VIPAFIGNTSGMDEAESRRSARHLNRRSTDAAAATARSRTTTRADTAANSGRRAEWIFGGVRYMGKRCSHDVSMSPIGIRS
jgi:hypothetical protein